MSLDDFLKDPSRSSNDNNDLLGSTVKYSVFDLVKDIWSLWTKKSENTSVSNDALNPKIVEALWQSGFIGASEDYDLPSVSEIEGGLNLDSLVKNSVTASFDPKTAAYKTGRPYLSLWCTSENINWFVKDVITQYKIDRNQRFQDFFRNGNAETISYKDENENKGFNSSSTKEVVITFKVKNGLNYSEDEITATWGEIRKYFNKHVAGDYFNKHVAGESLYGLFETEYAEYFSGENNINDIAIKDNDGNLILDEKIEPYQVDPLTTTYRLNASDELNQVVQYYDKIKAWVQKQLKALAQNGQIRKSSHNSEAKEKLEEFLNKLTQWKDARALALESMIENLARFKNEDNPLEGGLYFEPDSLQEQYAAISTMRKVRRFSPVNHVLDLNKVVRRVVFDEYRTPEYDEGSMGMLYVTANLLPLPSKYWSDWDDRVCYGFELFSEKDFSAYWLKFNFRQHPEEIYEKTYFAPLDLDRLKNDGVLYLPRFAATEEHWNSGMKGSQDLDIYSEILYRTFRKNSAGVSQMNNFSAEIPETGAQELYKIENSEFSEEITEDSQRFKLYFLDEFVSMYGFGIFRDLMVRKKADARFWIEENNPAPHTITAFSYDDCEFELGLNESFFVSKTQENQKDSALNKFKDPATDFRDNCDLGPVEKEIFESHSKKLYSGLSTFRASRGLFMEVYESSDLENFHYVSGVPVKSPYIIQEISGSDQIEEILSNPEYSGRVYGLFKTPQIRYGIYVDSLSKAALLRYNVFTMFDDNHFSYPTRDNLNGTYKSVYRSYEDIVEYACSFKPNEMVPFFKMNLLSTAYSSPWALMPSKVTMPNTLRTLENGSGQYEVIEHAAEDSQVFYRYFHHCKPVLTQVLTEPIELWKHIHRSTRVAMSADTLVKNETDTFTSGSHLEEYYLKKTSGNWQKTQFKSRNLWEDKWFNDSKVMHMPPQFELDYGTVSSRGLEKAESQAREYFDKKWKQSGFSDPELLNYLFFNYKTEYDTTPSGTIDGFPAYNLKFRFKLL